MKKRAGVKLSLALLLSLASCAFLNPIRCDAIQEVESLADDIYRRAYNSQVPDLTQEQWQKMKFLYRAHLANKAKLAAERLDFQEKFFDKVGEPLPSKEALLAIQAEINKRDTAIDEASILTAYQIRQILTPKQLRAIYLFDIDKEFSRAELTAEQEKKMLSIAMAEKSVKNALQKELLQHQFALELLLRTPVADEKAVLEKQNQINEVQGKIAQLDLMVKLKLRSVLNWQQSNRLYNTHRGDTYGALGLNSEQDNQIMELHCKRESNSDLARITVLNLCSDLQAKYEFPESSESELLGLQCQIDQLANQARDAETAMVVDMRVPLNPAQRDKIADIVRQGRTGTLVPLPFPEPNANSNMHHAHASHNMMSMALADAHAEHAGHNTINTQPANTHAEHAGHHMDSPSGAHAGHNDHHASMDSGNADAVHAGHHDNAEQASTPHNNTQSSHPDHDQMKSTGLQPSNFEGPGIDQKAVTVGMSSGDIRTDSYSQAVVALDSKDFAKAESIYRKLVAIEESSKEGAKAPTLYGLALTCMLQDRFAEAEPLFARSTELFDKQLGKDHLIVRNQLLLRAQCLKKMHREKEAEAIDDRARAIPQIPGLN